MWSNALTKIQGLSFHPFHQNGFQAIPGLVSRAACQQLRERMSQLVEEFDPSQSPASIFDTEEQRRVQKTDLYLLDSYRKISFFFEAGVFSPQGTLTKPKELALNKVGHALHTLDPVFREFCGAPEVGALMRGVGQQRPAVAQTMFIFKQPTVGGMVVPHQDSSFLHTTPPSVVGMWLALEDATVENGCLWAVPGSHKNGLKKRFCLRTLPSGERETYFQGLEGCSHDHEYSIEGQVPLEAEAGTVILLHGELVHMSHSNTSPHSRHAFTIHCVDMACEWFPGNWIATQDAFLPLPRATSCIP